MVASKVRTRRGRDLEEGEAGEAAHLGSGRGGRRRPLLLLFLLLLGVQLIPSSS